jgi:putative flippase GtrA
MPTSRGDKVTMLRHWARFNVVGAFGIAVQLATLAALVRGAGAHYLASTLVAVEASVLHNYVWHTRWTWADRIDASAAHGPMLLRFHLTSGGLSFAANAVFVPLLVDALGVDVLVANCATIAVCGVLNFLLSDRYAFV